MLIIIIGIDPPAMETYAYASSKAALHMLTRHMAQTLGQHNITVNAIAPGSFESKMMAATLERYGEAIKASVPMGRIGQPNDMASVCLWLAGRGGSYVHGSVLVVDGGALISKGWGPSKL
jgi:NAD(P)-dependent dehydrogenase (short-subunit alcohol dehydrogenase family)